MPTYVVSDVYADNASQLFDALTSGAQTARTLTAQQRDLDNTLMAAVGLCNIGTDVIARSTPYVIRSARDFVRTAALLDEYSPEIFCTIRNYYGVEPKVKASFGGNGYSLGRDTHRNRGAGNPIYLPR